MKYQIPTLETAPKTLRESIERIVSYAANRRLANGWYVDPANHYQTCAIGLFFTAEQRRDILARGLNGELVTFVAKEIGVPNIEAMTGMSIEQATAIQRMNDTNSNYLLLFFVNS